MTWYSFEIKNEESQERRFRMRSEFNIIYKYNKDSLKDTALMALRLEHAVLYFISVTPQSLALFAGFLQQQSAQPSAPPSYDFMDSLKHCDGDEGVLKSLRREKI
jgi:hypothetical protein